MDNVARQIGLRLRVLRTERNLTSTRLARLLDTTQQAISSLERGTHRPSVGVIENLAKALNVKPIELFVETSTPTPVGVPLRGKWNPDVPLQKQIGERILDLHLNSGMTQRALAKKAGINNSSLSSIESGKARAKLATLEKIAKALNTTLENFLDFDTPLPHNSCLDRWTKD